MIDYDPFSEAARTDALPIYARLRDEAPAHYISKYDAWALSRFQDIWDCSSDSRFSTASGTTPAQVLTKDQPVTPMLNVMDPPDHTKLRAAIGKCFLPKHLKALEPVAREVFSGLVDEVFERGECDLVQDLAAKLSVQVARLAIGLPVEDGPLLVDLVSRFFAHDPGRQGMTADGLAALQELTDYGVEKARDRRRAAGNGPEALDQLVKFEPSGGRFSDDEIASHLTMLVIGGSETFPKTLANGIVRTRGRPERNPGRLRRDPAIRHAYAVPVPDAHGRHRASRAHVASRAGSPLPVRVRESRRPRVRRSRSLRHSALREALPDVRCGHARMSRDSRGSYGGEDHARDDPVPDAGLRGRPRQRGAAAHGIRAGLFAASDPLLARRQSRSQESGFRRKK